MKAGEAEYSTPDSNPTMAPANPYRYQQPGHEQRLPAAQPQRQAPPVDTMDTMFTQAQPRQRSLLDIADSKSRLRNMYIIQYKAAVIWVVRI